MSKKQLYDFGMVGLGVMGRNFLLNVADHGYSIIGLDNNQEQAEALVEEAGDKPAKATTDMKDFVASLKKPRKIMLLVPAGKNTIRLLPPLTATLKELAESVRILDEVFAELGKN